jgi:hypothetical protein
MWASGEKGQQLKNNKIKIKESSEINMENI